MLLLVLTSFCDAPGHSCRGVAWRFARHSLVLVSMTAALAAARPLECASEAAASACDMEQAFVACQHGGGADLVVPGCYCSNGIARTCSDTCDTAGEPAECTRWCRDVHSMSCIGSSAENSVDESENDSTAEDDAHDCKWNCSWLHLALTIPSFVVTCVVTVCYAVSVCRARRQRLNGQGQCSCRSHSSSIPVEACLLTGAMAPTESALLGNVAGPEKGGRLQTVSRALCDGENR